MPSDNSVTTFEMRTQRPTKSAEQTAYGLLFLVCLGHFLNDGIQSVIPAALPILRDAHGLTFTQVGLITLVIQVTSSLLQPLVGLTTDKHPTKYMLAIGMCCTLVGLVALSQASVFASMLLAVAFLGFGSAVFHPEATRIAQFASGGRKGLAQSVFQVGGNAGMALGPLAAAFVVIPYDWSLKKAAWYKALTANAEVVECNSVSARELPSWFAARLAKKNLKVEPAALKILSDRCEGNLLAAAQEVLKLAYLFPEGSVITEEAVTDSVRDVARFDVENLLEAMFAGDAAKSLRIVENLNAAGESIPSFMWMITEELRMTLKFRAAIDNGSDRNSALRQAGIWGDRSSRITRAAGRLNTRKLSSALLLCADIDKISKGLTVPNRDTDPWIEIAALAAFVAS